MSEIPIVLAICPGPEGCGLARVDEAGVSSWHRTANWSQLERALSELSSRPPEVVVITAGNGPRNPRAVIIRHFGADKVKVLEKEPTEEAARTLYFADHPPTGLWALLPRRFIRLPTAILDYMAIVSAQAWLASRRGR